MLRISCWIPVNATPDHFLAASFRLHDRFGFVKKMFNRRGIKPWWWSFTPVHIEVRRILKQSVPSSSYSNNLDLTSALITP